MKGLTRIARRAVLARMKAHSGLTALVPAASIHPQTVLGNPEWPFIKLGRQSTITFGENFEGALVSTPVSGFARSGENAAGGTTQTAEDAASLIGEQIEEALQKRGDSATGYRMTHRVRDINIGPDAGESGAFRWFCNVETRVIADSEA
jgi:hypothetical protein